MRVQVVLCACALVACSVSDTGANLGRTVEENDSAWELARAAPATPSCRAIR